MAARLGSVKTKLFYSGVAKTQQQPLESLAMAPLHTQAASNLESIILRGKRQLGLVSITELQTLTLHANLRDVVEAISMTFLASQRASL